MPLKVSLKIIVISLSQITVLKFVPLVLKRSKSILFLFSLILNMSYYQEYLTLLKKIVVAIVTGKYKVSIVELNFLS